MKPQDLKFTKANEFKQNKITLPCLIEEKIDGHRMMLWRGHAYGRKVDSHGYWVNKWNKLPPHIQQLATDEPVDGELRVVGGEASDVITHMNEKSTALQFISFCLPRRKLYPHQHLDCLLDMGFLAPDVLHIPLFTTEDHYTIIDKPLSVTSVGILEHAKHRKIEGWILKEKCKYPIWWKLKVVKTYDLIITDFTWPTAGRNKTNNWIKSLICSAYVKGKLTIVANVSGMIDELRAIISADPDRFRGKIIEVKANLLASKGKLRHPRFIRFREDKNEQECQIR